MKSLILYAIIGILSCSVGCTNAQVKADKKSSDTLYTYRAASSGGIGKFYLGREIAYVMGASNSSWLDRNSRPQEENTQLAIDKIDVPATAVIADIGAGTGYYTFKLAPKVPKGKVYAVEIQDEMIEIVKERAKKMNVTNVEVIKGGFSSPNLPENSVDLAIMVDVYHEFEYPVEMLQAIRKSLKKDGKLLLIEYKGEDPEVAIRPLHKTTVAQLRKELGANGFKLDYNGQFMPIQHFLLFKKTE
ncbi:class I SAM-dependent methyltransferase [Segetibacter aerophilus]|uniref:Methyltransferase type 11 n=1 Tax=Segetibacter aerophilus TaxID=670293 RepID=A0A512B7N3_9BACT|nr:class I SAM-dependent methyltransferase [Segetibacter aerophilus]GEO07965.1 methyltransferase type 11 [Segetibacter aerophilus]